jgi:hypothetical protein
VTKQLDDMWSSKWVLPEHREALIENDRSLLQKMEPELDEQEVAEINQAIYSAKETDRPIILTVFGKYKLNTIVGTVFKMDHNFKMIKIKFEDPSKENDECVWIHMRDILKAEVKEIEEFDDVGWE